MIKYWISLLCSVIISVTSQMLLKKAASKEYKFKIYEYVNINVIFAYLLMVLSTICVIYAYKEIELKNGVAIESLGYVLAMIFGYICFGEKITKNKIIGNTFIIIGILVFYM